MCEERWAYLDQKASYIYEERWAYIDLKGTCVKKDEPTLTRILAKYVKKGGSTLTSEVRCAKVGIISQRLAIYHCVTTLQIGNQFRAIIPTTLPH